MKTLYRRIFVFIFCLISICFSFSDKASKMNYLNVERAYNFSFLWKFEPDILGSFRKIILPVNLETLQRMGGLLTSMECFHSRGQHLCKFIGTKESVCIRKEFNSHRTGLGHQHGRCFIVLGHQYGSRDVMWKHSIDALEAIYTNCSN